MRWCPRPTRAGASTALDEVVSSTAAVGWTVAVIRVVLRPRPGSGVRRDRRGPARSFRGTSLLPERYGAGLRRCGRSTAQAVEAGVGVAAVQVGQNEQSLPTGGQATPPGADPTAMTCEKTGEAWQGAAGRIDAGRVDKHAENPWRAGDLDRQPVHQGPSSLAAGGAPPGPLTPRRPDALTPRRAVAVTGCRPVTFHPVAPPAAPRAPPARPAPARASRPAPDDRRGRRTPPGAGSRRPP